MKNIKLAVRAVLFVSFLAASEQLSATPVLSNGDFTDGLSGWTTQNSGQGDDTVVVWEIADPSGSNQITINGNSGGPASRVIYQDFTVPALGVDTAGFTYDYFAQNNSALNSDTFTTFENLGLNGGHDGTRIDILDPADDVFTGTVLYTLFAPTDAAPVGSDTSLVSYSFADASGLISFLNAHAGETLRLRIGNREEDFPWQTGFDNFNLDITAPLTQPVPTLSEWGKILLILAFGLIAARKLKYLRTEKMGHRT